MRSLPSPGGRGAGGEGELHSRRVAISIGPEFGTGPDQVKEAAWASLYTTTSYPFDPPKTGKIAVKVINHFGDEVLKVYLI